MSLMAISNVFSVRVGSPIRKMVLLKLADYANDDGECSLPPSTLARDCEIAPADLRVHLRALEKAGYVKISRRRGAPQLTCYRLTLQDHLCCNGELAL